MQIGLFNLKHERGEVLFSYSLKKKHSTRQVSNIFQRRKFNHFNAFLYSNIIAYNPSSFNIELILQITIRKSEVKSRLVLILRQSINVCMKRIDFIKNWDWLHSPYSLLVLHLLWSWFSSNRKSIKILYIFLTITVLCLLSVLCGFVDMGACALKLTL